MYTEENFKTKKQLKAAVEAWNKYVANGSDNGQNPPAITYYQPGPFGWLEQKNGTFYVEGPHYPEPHRWYATCTAKNGVIVKVK